MHIKNHHGDDIIKMTNFYPHKDMNTLCILLLFCRHIVEVNFLVSTGVALHVVVYRGKRQTSVL